MTEAARVERYIKGENQLTDGDGELVRYADYQKLEADRDSLAALVERMRDLFAKIKMEHTSHLGQTTVKPKYRGSCRPDCLRCAIENILKQPTAA